MGNLVRRVFDYLGGGAGVVITNPQGYNVAIATKLSFDCSNNMAEYEALIIGVTTALSKGVRNVMIQGDSRVIVQQMVGNFAVKEPALAIYITLLQHLLAKFEQYKLKHIPRTQNRYPDALATMASKMAM